MTLVLYQLFQPDKKPARALVSQIKVKLNKTFIVSLSPSPEGQCMQGAKYYLAPEVPEKPVIAEGKK